MKKRIIRIILVILFVGCAGLGVVLLKSDKAQLQLQVDAASHIDKLLPLIPEDFIDHRVVKEYGDVLDNFMSHIDMKVLSHTTKTSNTGVATIEVTVPVIQGQVTNMMLTSTNTNVQNALSRVSDPDEISKEWVLDQISYEFKDIDFAIAKKNTIMLEIPTFAMKGTVWSFSKDALPDAIDEVFEAMGFTQKWREEFIKAIP